MEKIRAMANRDKAEFQKRFEMYSDIEQYGKIIERVPHEKFWEFAEDKRPLEEKLPAMREYYYSIMQNGGKSNGNFESIWRKERNGKSDFC